MCPIRTAPIFFSSLSFRLHGACRTFREASVSQVLLLENVGFVVFFSDVGWAGGKTVKKFPQKSPQLGARIGAGSSS